MIDIPALIEKLNAAIPYQAKVQHVASMTEVVAALTRLERERDALREALKRCLGLIDEIRDDIPDDDLRLMATVVADDARAALEAKP